MLNWDPAASVGRGRGRGRVNGDSPVVFDPGVTLDIADSGEERRAAGGACVGFCRPDAGRHRSVPAAAPTPGTELVSGVRVTSKALI